MDLELAQVCPACGHRSLYGIDVAEMSTPVAYSCADCLESWGPTDPVFDPPQPDPVVERRQRRRSRTLDLLRRIVP